MLLIPFGESVESMRAALLGALVARGNPFELRVNNDGRSRWFVFLHTDVHGNKTHADVTVYPSALFSRYGPVVGLNGAPVYPTKVQRAFSGLCKCTYSPTVATCFEAAPAYLAELYGDYMTPTSQHARHELLEEVLV